MLSKVEFDLIRIKRRLAFLDAILHELHIQTKGERFTVRNEVVWQMLWDSYQMAIVDLASFIKSLLGKGGFFNKLNNHLIQFRPGIHKEMPRRPVLHVDPPKLKADRQRIERELDDYRRRRLKEAVSESLQRLSPEREQTTGSPSATFKPSKIDWRSRSKLSCSSDKFSRTDSRRGSRRVS
jgi:hypothetical protein